MAGGIAPQAFFICGFFGAGHKSLLFTFSAGLGVSLAYGSKVAERPFVSAHIAKTRRCFGIRGTLTYLKFSNTINKLIDKY